MQGQKIVLIGPMGAGKTSLGRRLASRLGWRFMDSDQAICVKTGVDIPTIFNLEGEAGFRMREKEVLQELLSLPQNVVVACGGGVVLLPENQQLLRLQNFVILLDVSVKRQIERVGQDKNRPLMQSDDLVDHLKKMREQRLPLYKSVADFVVNTDSNHFPSILQQLILIAEQKLSIKSRLSNRLFKD